MHCPNCGAPLEPDSKFCAVCGQRVPTPAAVPAPAPAPRPGSYAQPAPAPAPQPGSYAQPAATPQQGGYAQPAPAPAPRYAPAPQPATSHATMPGTPGTTQRPSMEGSLGSQQIFPYDVRRFRRYFDPGSLMFVWILLIVSVIAFFSMISYFPTNVIWFLIAAVCASYIWWTKTNTATDAEVDQTYALLTSIGISESFEKTGMDKEGAAGKRANPIGLHGLNLTDTPARCWLHITYDGGLKALADFLSLFHLWFLASRVMREVWNTAEVRSSNYQVTVLYPLPEMLRIYVLQQSLTRSKRNVITRDVFYDDIVDMDIIEHFERDDEGAGNASVSDDYGKFRLNLTSGKNIEVPYEKSQYSEVIGVRTLLRNRRRESNTLLKDQLGRLKNIDESTAL